MVRVKGWLFHVAVCFVSLFGFCLCGAQRVPLGCGGEGGVGARLQPAGRLACVECRPELPWQGAGAYATACDAAFRRLHWCSTKQKQVDVSEYNKEWGRQTMYTVGIRQANESNHAMERG